MQHSDNTWMVTGLDSVDTECDHFTHNCAAELDMFVDPQRAHLESGWFNCISTTPQVVMSLQWHEANSLNVMLSGNRVSAGIWRWCLKETSALRHIWKSTHKITARMIIDKYGNSNPKIDCKKNRKSHSPRCNGFKDWLKYNQQSCEKNAVTLQLNHRLHLLRAGQLKSAGENKREIKWLECLCDAGLHIPMTKYLTEKYTQIRP